MGKLKKVLATLDNGVAIEVNEGDGQDIIHIQTGTWRVELTEGEYRELCAAVCSAALTLRWKKGD